MAVCILTLEMGIFCQVPLPSSTFKTPDLRRSFEEIILDILGLKKNLTLSFPFTYFYRGQLRVSSNHLDSTKLWFGLVWHSISPQENFQKSKPDLQQTL